MSQTTGSDLAGLAAREAGPHPAPITDELERLRAEVSLLQQEARIRQAINDGLAAEVAYLRACVPPAHPSDYGHEAWAEAVRAEVDAERAAVVAWLHTEADKFDGEGSDVLQTMFRCGACMSLINAADDIERGEHRKK